MKKLITISLIMISSFCFSQDAYFSNFYRSFALTNPSGIAMSEDINLTMLHRSQWMSIMTPFTTSQFEGYYPIRKANSNKKIMTIGISFVNEMLGEGGYLTTNNFSVTGAYDYSVGSNNHLAMGLKLGYFNGATDISGLSSGSQFQNGVYYSGNSLGENIVNPVVSGMGVSPSITWFKVDSNGTNVYNVGITAFNVNQPISSTTSQVADFKLPMRIALSSSGTIDFGNLGIVPRALAMIQGGENQIVIGSDLKYYISKTKEKNLALALGGYYRLNDAAILSAKYLSDKLDAGISYDFTTSGISDPLNTKSGSFEIFFDYKIKQHNKIKQYELLIEVYDKDTKQLITADASFTNTKTSVKGELFQNKSQATVNINQKDEYVIKLTKNNYNSESFTIINSDDESKTQKVYLSRTIRMFDLELEVLDKETDEAVNVVFSLIDQNSGKTTQLDTSNKLMKEFESGKKHTISLDIDGYDNSIVEIRYDKYGTLSKTVYVSKTKPELKATNLILTVLDETTKKPIKSTVMAINVTEKDHQNSLIALNDFPPESYPLEIGNKFEIFVTKEGYFNQTLKVSADEIKNLERAILLTSIEVGKSIIVDDLHFKTGKTTLDITSYRVLDQLVDFMNQNPTIKIELAGHTDSDGSEASNFKLSDGRANAAITYLNNKGISTDRLVAKGYGESKPLAPNTNAEGKAKNRRVELKIIGK